MSDRVAWRPSLGWSPRCTLTYNMKGTTMTRYTTAERSESLEWLRDRLSPGDTIHLIVRSVSRSGMSRKITPLLLSHNGEVSKRYLGFHVARVLDMPEPDGEMALTVKGAGMDMGFELVYQMGRALQLNADKSSDFGYDLRHEYL